MTSGIQNILQEVKKAVLALLEVDRFYIVLYDAGRTELEFPLVAEKSQELAWSSRPYQDNLLPDRVIACKETLRFSSGNFSGVLYWPTKDKPPFAWLGVPMIIAGQVIGVLVIEKNRVAFEERDEKIFSKIADQTGIAIYHVRKAEKESKDKGELLATVSHELRTPITGVKAVLENMLEGVYGSINEQQHSILGEVVERLNEEEKLVSNLIDFATIQQGKVRLNREFIDLGVMIQSIIHDFKPVAEKKGIELALNLSTNLTAQFDKNKIRHVISNLLDNAIKFTEEGKITVSAIAENGQIKVQVADTGIGISKEEQVRIFAKFYRVENSSAGGMGIGLNLVKEFIELHRGRVWVESEAGQGSTFVFTLPK